MASNSADMSHKTDVSIWVQAIKSYVMETEAFYLDLHSRNIEIEALRSVFKYLPDSHITRLNLEGGDLSDGMKNLADLLATSKIKELNIGFCSLTDEDLLNFMSTLKKSQITKLDFSKNHFQLDEKVATEFVSYLHQSQLTDLNFGFNPFDSEVGGLLLTQDLPNTLITHLNLKCALLTHDALVALFANLPNTAITNLNLSNNEITRDEMDALRVSLKSSKLKILDLSDNNITDAGVNILVEGLVQSEIVDLNLNSNDFHGSNSLGEHLKDTQIKFLNLGNNQIEEGAMFSSPDVWKNSSLVTLDVGGCGLSEDISRGLMRGLQHSKINKLVVRENNLQLPSVTEFANTVKHSEITDVDFSENYLHEREFVILGDCLKGSKIKSMDVSNNFKHPVGEKVLAELIKKTKGSGVQSLKMNNNKLLPHGAQAIARSLAYATFTEFDVSSNWIKHGVVTLAGALGGTVITHLDLSNNKIEDEGAAALAKDLKFSFIVSLNINTNSITDRGAKALAKELRNSHLLELKLEENAIENVGLEALAKGIENTFITVLDVKSNPGDRVLCVDSVLWKNRREKLKLIDCFKRITSQSRDGSIAFGRNLTRANLYTFLEDCLHFYKSISKERKQVVSVLSQDKTIIFSKSQITVFIEDEFWSQFLAILAAGFEVDVEQHVNFLRRAEEMELPSIVSRLLFNRHAFAINKTDNILHPYVYKLLAKYKLPEYNLNIEPGGKEKIIKYFQEHPNVEGAAGVINMLRSLP